jgi:tRNA A37 threonylcarbamoyladenosine synthetase subunit TsaC/SUA5/YrdC
MSVEMASETLIQTGQSRSARTDAAVDPAILSADCNAVLDAIAYGRIAIIPTCLTYAIVGHCAAAIAAIFAAKGRNYSKPCGLFGSPAISREIHDLPADKHEIARAVKEEERLPFSIVAPFRPGHPFLARVDPFVIRHASKDGTMDMVVSGGPFITRLAELSLERGVAVFGSSANRSLEGSRYRLQDIEPEVRAAASLALDYGVSRYASPLRLSSTIIDFRDFSVVRVGHEFQALEAAFRRRFGIMLRRPETA